MPFPPKANESSEQAPGPPSFAKKGKSKRGFGKKKQGVAPVQKRMMSGGRSLGRY